MVNPVFSVKYERTRLTERIGKIDRWNRQARRFLPIAGRLID